MPARASSRSRDIGKLKYGSKHFNVTADRTDPDGLATVGYDDDGVKTRSGRIVRDGILVGLQTNRETAHYIGEKASRGCTPATRGATIRSCGCRTCTSSRARGTRRRRSRSSPT